jgi:hypothetical protein
VTTSTLGRKAQWFVGGLIGLLVTVGLLGWIFDRDSLSSERIFGAVRNESKLVTASQEERIKVTYVDDSQLPAWLKGQKAVVEATGRVDAYFDLSQLEPDDMTVRGRTVTVELPEVNFDDPKISRIDWLVDDRGLLDRVEDFFSSDEDFRNQVIRELNAKLATQAGTPELERQAQQNAASVLERLLEPLGVERVITESPASGRG